MDEQRPLVSAIIPTYNRCGLLERALRSVVEQDYRPIEAVVIDDGSTDDTAGVILQWRSLLQRDGVELISFRQNHGRAPAARNVGMKLARGQLYGFLDSDDSWRPRFVSTMVRLLDEHRSAGLAFCGMHVIDENDRVWDSRKSGLPRQPRESILEKPFERIIRHMPLQTSGTVVRRSVIGQIGDFDLNLPVVEDWDLWYRIAGRYDFAYTTEHLACNRCHRSNLPKFDCVALASGLRMNLKHLPAVQDPSTREMLVNRMERQFVLLQEELLRRGKEQNGYGKLLAHELARRSPRFQLGAILARGPTWAGRSYAWLIRAAGNIRRGVDD